MNEAATSSNHPVHVASNRVGESGAPAHDRSVVGIDPQLIERLHIGKTCRDLRLARRFSMPGGQHASQSTSNRWLRFTRKKALFPVAPRLRRAGHGEGQGLRVHI